MKTQTLPWVHCPFFTFNLDISFWGLDRSVGTISLDISHKLSIPSCDRKLADLTDRCFYVQHQFCMNFRKYKTKWLWKLEPGDHSWKQVIKSVQFFLRTCHPLVSGSHSPILSLTALWSSLRLCRCFRSTLSTFSTSWRGADSAAGVIAANRARPHFRPLGLTSETFHGRLDRTFAYPAMHM